MKQIGYKIICLAILLTSLLPVKATSEGAFISGRSVTYANPMTNTTQDGGSNIALGQSMADSITEKQMLIEIVDGHIYATVGLGLASNTSNVRFNLLKEDGTTYSVNSVKTGSSTNNGDTVNHYRIELSYLGQWISPVLYVTPMGRDVQFFISSDQNLVAGTGIYNSQMIPKKQEETTTQKTDDTTNHPSSQNDSASDDTANQSSSKSDSSSNDTSTNTPDVSNEVNETKPQESVEMTLTPVSKEQLFDQTTGLSIHKILETKQQPHTFIVVTLGCIIVLLIIGGYSYVKKIKK